MALDENNSDAGTRRLIEELDAHVDSTSNRLERAQRRMDRFIKSNKSEGDGRLVLHLTLTASRRFSIFVDDSDSHHHSQRLAVHHHLRLALFR